MLVDAGDIVVHIMQPAVRAYYNLEELWAPRDQPPRRRRRAQPERASASDRADDAARVGRSMRSRPTPLAA